MDRTSLCLIKVSYHKELGKATAFGKLRQKNYGNRIFELFYGKSGKNFHKSRKLRLFKRKK